jgi:hypothetical protein
MTMTRWAMACALILAAWILMSPFVIETDPRTAWDFYAAGVLGVLLAAAAMLRSDDLAENGLLAVGGWLMISPWILGLPELASRQAIFYGAIVAAIGWFGRPSRAIKTAA